MILNAPSSIHFTDQDRLITMENLFQNNTAAKIAVHIRRGDIQDALGWHTVVPDNSFVNLIKKLQAMFCKLGRESEVHVFSEDCGPVNWTSYTGVVDYFHLAPKMSTDQNAHVMDIALNIRNWKHFALADVLIVGGTFSKTVSYGRAPPDPVTGLPLTIHS